MRYLLLLALLGMVAPASAEILDVQFSNLSSSSATITWITSDDADGCVNYGLTTGLGESTCDPRPDDRVHFVLLTDLLAESVYYFEVVSGGETDDNQGAYYSFSTTEIESGFPYVIFGYVMLYNGMNPAVEALVSVGVRSATGSSFPLTSLTDTGGSWVLNLGNLKDAGDGSVFSFTVGDTLEISVVLSIEETAGVVTHVTGMSPQNTGMLILSPSSGVSDDLVRERTPTLLGGAPNPFSHATTIRYSLAEAGPVRLEIFDATGRLVRNFPSQSTAVGPQILVWDGTNESGGRVPAGIYYVRLTAGETRLTRPIAFVR